MIKIRKNKVTFTGKELHQLIKTSKEINLSPQDTFTGMLWEYIMKCAREGLFKNER